MLHMATNWLDFHRLRVARLRKTKIFEDLVITYGSCMIKPTAVACSKAWSLLSSTTVQSPTQNDARLRKRIETDFFSQTNTY